MSDTGTTAKERLHQAICDYVAETDGQIVVQWCLTVELNGTNGPWLAHRAGGGIDGAENPSPWTALGMLRASVGVAEQQLLDTTHDADDDED